MDNSANRLEDQFYRNGRVRNLMAAFGLAMLLLVGRLFYLQVVQGPYNEKLSVQNSMRLKIIHAPRGLIEDRAGVVIARNRPSYQIAILNTELKRPKEVFANLMRFTDSTGRRIFDSAQVKFGLEHGKWRKWQPQVILEDADPEVVASVEEHQLDLPGVITLVESRRSYPFGTHAAHALGYMDEIKEDELDELRGEVDANGDSLPYAKGDRIGRKGLEKTYESTFRGKDGVKYVKVNALGKELEVLRDMPQINPVPGNDLVTSLDMDLQNFTDSILPDTVKGAVVAIDPRDGGILVMASSPHINSNIFSLSKERRAKEWAKLALDPAMPLNNRATVGGYEPGSTFKGIVSVAAFRNGIAPTNHMPKGCTGGYRFGNRVWHCWDPKGHGSLNFYDAFTRSCDVYYYQLGLDLGMDAINSVAREFGLGAKTGVDLDDERAGTLVDEASYNRRYRKLGWVWTKGLTLNLSIGQGEIATPLQLANYAAGLGNGKVIYRPHFIREIRDDRGHTLSTYQPQVLSQLKMTEAQHQDMLKAMESVVNSPSGTGGKAKVKDVVVGGKSGSAENPHGGKTHALFIAVAPLYNPEIAIAVVLENAGHGGSFAAPIVGQVLGHYFHRRPGR